MRLMETGEGAIRESDRRKDRRTRFAELIFDGPTTDSPGRALKNRCKMRWASEGQGLVKKSRSYIDPGPSTAACLTARNNLEEGAIEWVGRAVRGSI